MSTVGEIEKRTQARVLKLFREQRGYEYLGGWTDREGNRNIEEELLRTFLREKQGYDEAPGRNRAPSRTRWTARLSSSVARRASSN